LLTLMSGGLLPISPNSQARRIAANVAKLPDLVRTVVVGSPGERKQRINLL
jgi:hypothetical protein